MPISTPSVLNLRLLSIDKTRSILDKRIDLTVYSSKYDLLEILEKEEVKIYMKKPFKSGVLGLSLVILLSSLSLLSSAFEVEMGGEVIVDREIEGELIAVGEKVKSLLPLKQLKQVGLGKPWVIFRNADNKGI